MKKRCYPHLLLMLSLVFTLNSPVLAAGSVSKAQAVSIVQRAHPGRVLSVKQSGGIYRVKILSEKGEVRIVRVDAASGKLLSGR